MVGRTIVSTSVLHPRAARNQAGGGAEIEANLTGLKVGDTNRRGKFLWLELDDVAEQAPSGLGLLVHLGMSGQMLVKSPDASPTPNCGHGRS